MSKELNVKKEGVESGLMNDVRHIRSGILDAGFRTARESGKRAEAAPENEHPEASEWDIHSDALKTTSAMFSGPFDGIMSEEVGSKASGSAKNRAFSGARQRKER